MAFTTRKSLLAKVRAGDEVSWAEFYAAYKPLILLCGQDCMLTSDENDELVQQVMSEVFKKDIVGRYDPDHIPDDVVFHYDPSHGRFRHYLRKIIRNQALKIYQKRKAYIELDNPAQQIPEPAVDTWDNLWNEEWKRHVLAMALTELKGHVQPETYVAFEMYALQERPVQEVAKFLNLSVASVYTAKSRCIAALKEIIQKLEEH